MKSFIKLMDGLPLLLKIILAIPALDIVWNIYRVCRSLVKKNTLGAVLGVLIIFFFSWNIIAILDIICLLLNKKVWWID